LTSTPKLAELRARTDRQLAEYVHRRVELGFHLAHAQSWASAEAACAEAARLLPLIYGLEESQRRRLEIALEQLRETLDAPCLRAAS